MFKACKLDLALGRAELDHALAVAMQVTRGDLEKAQELLFVPWEQGNQTLSPAELVRQGKLPQALKAMHDAVDSARQASEKLQENLRTQIPGSFT